MTTNIATRDASPQYGFVLRAETVARHREWSVRNFGDRDERGPVGPLKHLSKEALEAAEAPRDIMEFADLMFLVLDSMYRAGHTCEQLNDAMDAKQVVLDQRVYRKVAGDVPIEHDRSLDKPKFCREDCVCQQEFGQVVCAEHMSEPRVWLRQTEAGHYIRADHEEIFVAAIKDSEGRPVCLPRPARHHDIIRAMADNGHKTPITGEQGFVTTRGRFVGRKEALEIATKAGQIIKKHGNPTILFSEDLW